MVQHQGRQPAGGFNPALHCVSPPTQCRRRNIHRLGDAFRASAGRLAGQRVVQQPFCCSTAEGRLPHWVQLIGSLSCTSRAAMRNSLLSVTLDALLARLMICC